MLGPYKHIAEGLAVETRKQAWVIAAILLLALAVVLMGMPAMAQSYDPDEDLPVQTGVEKALTKLGRGLSNIMLGWAEIPVTLNKKMKAGKPLGYLIGVVPVLGTARAMMRTSTGMFEVVSFPFSDREVNYDPILEPEYIF
jgi:putative exosortase-associated protein (TIGR04073 family)